MGKDEGSRGPDSPRATGSRARGAQRESAPDASWLAILQDVTRAANEALSLHDAVRHALRRISDHGGWSLAQSYLLGGAGPGVLLPFESWLDKSRPAFRPLRDAIRTMSFPRGEGLPGRILESGEPVHVAGPGNGPPELAARAREAGVLSVMAFPILVGSGTVGVLQFWSDRAVPPAPALADLYRHVGTQLGRVFERVHFQEEFANAIGEEQRELGQELHDGIGQQLAGLELMCRSLIEGLYGRKAALAAAIKVSDGIHAVSQKVSALAHGLYPVEVDAEGLDPALQSLADSTAVAHGIECVFVNGRSHCAPESRVATQMVRVAQEAVTNAVRHAKAGRIVVSLHCAASVLTLEVADNGIGIPEPPREGKGLGLRIMRNRAASVGATLSIASAPEGGTRVICSVLCAPPEPEEDRA